MKLVCACGGAEGVMDCTGCNDYNYAVIEMPEAYVAWLRQQWDVVATLREAEPDLRYVAYYDHQVSYHSALAPLQAEVGGATFLRVPDAFEPAEEPLPIAHATVAVAADYLTWRAYPKHGEGQFATAVLHKVAFRRLVQMTDAPMPTGA